MNLNLWTSASGMRVQQRRIDVIANNIANVNTNGFRASRVAFGDTPYIRSAMDSDIQVGTGVNLASIWRDRAPGMILPTGRSLDMAIEGDGYFRLRTPDGQTVYTRAGVFNSDAEGNVTDPYGNLLLLDDDDPLQLPSKTTKFTIDADGKVSIESLDKDGDPVTSSPGKIALAVFPNESGLEALGNNLFRRSDASGDEVLDEAAGRIRTGSLETSNVDLAGQMVDMILAQRAYSLNARAIQTADQMSAMANDLRR